MRKTAKALLLTSVLFPILAFSIGCSDNEKETGADIKIEEVSLGGMGIEGKTITGLPSDEVSLLLDVSAEEIKVRYDEEGVTLTANPSGATIEIRDGGISIKGVKPEQLKVEWGTNE